MYLYILKWYSILSWSHKRLINNEYVVSFRYFLLFCCRFYFGDQILWQVVLIFFRVLYSNVHYMHAVRFYEFGIVYISCEKRMSIALTRCNFFQQSILNISRAASGGSAWRSPCLYFLEKLPISESLLRMKPCNSSIENYKETRW